LSIESFTLRRRPTLGPGRRRTSKDLFARIGASLIASIVVLVLLPSVRGQAEQPKTPLAGSATAASDIADFFRTVGDQIYDDCIFELSQEQLEVQQELIKVYIQMGATGALARQLAVKQIQPPRLSDKCEQIRRSPRAKPSIAVNLPPVAKPPSPAPVLAKLPPEKLSPEKLVTTPLASRSVLPQWDCASDVDYVTIRHKGYERKLTGGEICNPFDDVVRKVPDSAKTFRIGYSIRTGRLFVISDNPQVNGTSIAWAISGREVCRNNPDPDCLAARAVGPLPPGEYSLASEKDHRVSWGPTSKRMVAGIYLKTLWNRDKFTPAQTSAILARGNIAIHVRLKGEMSEACLGLGPNGWAYVSSLIKEGRVTGVNAYIDEPYPQLAGAAPILKTSTFSLSFLSNLSK
jgi:hypothetical protein